MKRQLNESIRSFIGEQEKKGHLAPGTGLAVVVIENGAPIFQDAFGLRDRERKLPVTLETVFEGCSATKGFTATAVMIAHEKKLLDIFSPLNAAGPLLRLMDEEVNKELTVGDILTHRTGMTAHDFLWYFAHGDADALAKAIRHLELIPDGFRNIFHYNNLMYGVLGALFPALTGETWERFVEKEIFAPLGLQSSTVTGPISQNVALAYAGDRLLRNKEVAHIGAAGALRTTIQDVGRWLAFHLGASKSTILGADSLTQMRAPQITVGTPNPIIFQGLEWLSEDRAYGLGWFTGRANGKKVTYHPGFTDGFSTALVMFPGEKIGLAVLSNTNLSPIPGKLIQRLAGNVFGETFSDPAPATASAASAGAEEVTNLGILSGSAIEGIFAHPGYGELQIRARKEIVEITLNGNTWGVDLQGSNAVINTIAFGIPIPLPATFEIVDGRADKVSIPFSLDPRVPPQAFVRVDRN